MRHLTIGMDDAFTRRAYRVVNLDMLACSWHPDLQFAVRTFDHAGRQQVLSLAQKGLQNVCWIDGMLLEAGDVVVPQPDSGKVAVAYRDSDLHHALFLTNRCNSFCVMCSQPPTKHDDGWLADEARDIVQHIGTSPVSIGLTGGEPVLLGSKLRDIIDMLQVLHPTTRIDVLTNGRLLSGEGLAASILSNLEANAKWLVPLYGHADFLHDFVVQSPGAFEETIEGLLALQSYGQAIQLRIVLIAPVLEHLVQLCEFIGRNLPFVREVALMSCEPIGFALANRDLCEVDLLEWSETLSTASRTLRRYRIRHLFMNAPLCALPESLWPHAHRSISDWKQVYAAECGGCTQKTNCAGLFAWHSRGWTPAKIRAIEEKAHE